jgi:hypothetical protein
LSCLLDRSPSCTVRHTLHHQQCCILQHTQYRTLQQNKTRPHTLEALNRSSQANFKYSTATITRTLYSTRIPITLHPTNYPPSPHHSPRHCTRPFSTLNLREPLNFTLRRIPLAGRTNTFRFGRLRLANLPLSTSTLQVITLTITYNKSHVHTSQSYPDSRPSSCSFTFVLPFLGSVTSFRKPALYIPMCSKIQTLTETRER